MLRMNVGARHHLRGRAIGLETRLLARHFSLLGGKTTSFRVCFLGALRSLWQRRKLVLSVRGVTVTDPGNKTAIYLYRVI
jgi:hypothetical protein